MNKQQKLERSRHTFAETGTIKRVTEREVGYSIDSTVGCFLLNEACEEPPAKGMSVTIYRYDGSGIQGIDLDEKPVFFKTKKQLEEQRREAIRQIDIRKAKEREEFYNKLDDPHSDFNIRWNKLPKVYRQRIARFFRLGDGFWDVAVYELYTCEAAVKIAYACNSQSRVLVFMRSSPDEERLSVLGEDIFNYLSSHQFTFACALAHSYLKKAKSVRTRPGAMQMLAGKKTYTG